MKRFSLALLVLLVTSCGWNAAGDKAIALHAFEFVMSEPARCPNCGAELTEKTLVEPQGGIEVETHA